MYHSKYAGRMPERQDSDRINEHIRLSPVRVIDPDGKNIGIIPTARALQMARECELDLVEVAPQARPPVCRIMDYSKFKYEKKLKEKEERAKQRQQPEVKGMRFSSTIGEGDMETKLARIREFIGQGHKVKIEMRYRRGAAAHREVGFQVMRQLIERLKEVAAVINPPVLLGKNVQCLLGPVAVKT